MASSRVGPQTAVGVTTNAWIRNGRRTRAWAVVALVLSIAFAGSALLPGHFPSHAGGVAGVIAGVVYLGVLAGGIALARRIARAGLWIDATSIVVRGPFRTWSVAPGEAGVFAPGLQGAGGNGVPCPLLSRADRRAVGVWALGRRNIWFRYQRVCQEIEPLCAELNALIARLQSPARSA